MNWPGLSKKILFPVTHLTAGASIAQYSSARNFAL
jgi:hypothetical protein